MNPNFGFRCARCYAKKEIYVSPSRLHAQRDQVRYCDLSCWAASRRKSLEDVFRSKVDRDGPVLRADLGPCWLWTGHRNPAGYGVISIRTQTVGKKMLAAHRVSWTLAHGEIRGGLWVLHKCDNPSCVNPDHLFLGTSQDNVDDKVAKGRMRPLRREDHPGSKLTAEIVRFIRTDPRDAHALGRELGLSFSHVARVRRGEIWQEVQP